MTGTETFRLMFGREMGREPVAGVPLAFHSTFRIGGPADLFFEAGTADELGRAVRLAADAAFPCYVIGGGSNVLFDDRGFRGLMVRNSAEEVTAEGGRLTASSGTRLGFLLGRAVHLGLTGLEFTAGIPGTVGGAVFGNAGAFGRSVADCLTAVRVMDPGGEAREIELGRDALSFSYRQSRLKSTGEIVLEAFFRAVPGDKAASEALVASYLGQRKVKHPPWGTACAGSYFKNPTAPDGARIAAGKLLDEAGARGQAVGGAAVYEKHCNFIINKGGATARDVLALADRLKKLVLDHSGMALEPEVIYVRPDASRP